MPMRAHELILAFYKRLPTYNPQGLIELEAPIRKTSSKIRPGKDYVYKESTLRGKEYVTHFRNYPRSVVKYGYGNSSANRLHPTQKPLALFEYLILTYSNAGDTVFDSCMGSGTTGAACVNTGRRFIGFELDERYFNIARDRVCLPLAARKEEGG
jgi:site-specific DNA-methyltransferase (adenine-specific)